MAAKKVLSNQGVVMKNKEYFLSSFILISLIFLLAGFLNVHVYSQEEVSADSQKVEEKQGIEDEQKQEAKVAISRIDIYFDNTDIRDVVKILAEKGNVNMIVSDKAQANVTLKLNDTQWDRALDLILRTYNLTYRKEDNLVRVMTFEEAEQEEKLVPMDTKIIPLNFAQAGVISGSVGKMLSSRGSIQADARTNSIIITDIKDRIVQIEEAIKLLDKPTPQVLIEALVLDVSLTDEDEFGVNWQAVKEVTNLDTAVYDPQKSLTLTANSSYFSAANAFRVAMLKRQGDFDLDATITAWIQNKKAKVLANPRLLTLDNIEAQIEITQQVPYTQISSSEQGSNSGTAFLDIGTRLFVTAHITNDGHVSMNLRPAQEVQVGTSDDGVPIVDRRTAQTNVLVMDGQTVVIGGLRRVDKSVSYTKIPILGDMPLIGRLFRKRDIHTQDTELLIFVTPRVVKEEPKLDFAERQKFLDAQSKPFKGFDDVGYVEQKSFGLRPPKKEELKNEQK